MKAISEKRRWKDQNPNLIHNFFFIINNKKINKSGLQIIAK